MLELARFLLENRTWAQSCRRVNIVKPEEVMVSATGFRWARVASNVVHNTKTQDLLLRKALSAVAPVWWGDETQITVNRNVVCKPHVDKNNSEYSYIAFLGDVKGGALLFEDGLRLEEPYKWHKIRAKEVLRWSEPIEAGVKHSVVLYRKKSRAPPQGPSAGRRSPGKSRAIRRGRG